ncbi:MAG TPA: class I SAM-dependent methyltransferase [Candidatus Bathyarchaeia archaeon]|nr:class I SAM-dependent methyltransferase [Candidatus Bathyarchaeia archaeon]
MQLKLIARLIIITPLFLRRFLRRLGLTPIIDIFLTKEEGELIFQLTWVNKFRKNKNKLLQYWNKSRSLEQIKKICQFKKKTKVLDVGCGIMTVLHFIKGRRYGIDPLIDEYKKIYSYPKGINVIKAGAEKTPFPANFFDVVFCTNALDHVNDIKQAVAEITRVLKTKGYFVLIVDIFKKKHRRDVPHPYTLTKKDVLFLIKKNFKIIFENKSTQSRSDLYMKNKPSKRKFQELVLILKKE